MGIDEKCKLIPKNPITKKAELNLKTDRLSSKYLKLHIFVYISYRNSRPMCRSLARAAVVVRQRRQQLGDG